ncbi:hypothetical protein QZH41_016302, partial [Actinostola sp. cb2023]
PVYLQSAYKEELKRLQELGILCEVKYEYTPWISSTVVTAKPNGSIRICLDPRDLNKAVKRNPYYVKSVDDIIPKVSGATHFNGLPLGITCSGDVFQEKMDYTFGGLKGVSGITDDTFIYGTDNALKGHRIVIPERLGHMGYRSAKLTELPLLIASYLVQQSFLTTEPIAHKYLPVGDFNALHQAKMMRNVCSIANKARGSNISTSQPENYKSCTQDNPLLCTDLGQRDLGH